jgi:hypothetical protein
MKALGPLVFAFRLRVARRPAGGSSCRRGFSPVGPDRADAGRGSPEWISQTTESAGRVGQRLDCAAGYARRRHRAGRRSAAIRASARPRPLRDWVLDAFAPSSDPDRRTAATARRDAQGRLRRPSARGGRPPLTPMRGRAYACAASRPDDRRLRAEESPGSTRTRRRITSGGGDPRDSATESKPPAQSSKGRGR